MKIGKNAVVSINYTLKDDDAKTIDSSEGKPPLAYIHGLGQIVPGLAQALDGKQAGDSIQVSVAPTDGYGERADDRVVEVPRDSLPTEIEPEAGMMLATESPTGEVIPLWVTKVSDGNVTLDGNHPLAGQTLHFDVTIVEVREATSEEMEHGHVHGPGGHHH